MVKVKFSTELNLLWVLLFYNEKLSNHYQREQKSKFSTKPIETAFLVSKLLTAQLIVQTTKRYNVPTT